MQYTFTKLQEASLWVAKTTDQILYSLLLTIQNSLPLAIKTVNIQPMTNTVASAKHVLLLPLLLFNSFKTTHEVMQDSASSRTFKQQENLIRALGC